MNLKNTAQKMVTIVDDNLDILETIESMINNIDSDIKVKKWLNPIDAQFDIRDNKPDLLITDFNMPKMNGDQLAFSAREFHKDLPIVLFSGTYDKPTFDYFDSITKGSVNNYDKLQSIFEKIFKKA